MALNHISKFLSLILRHKPETIGVTLDKNGWTSVLSIVSGMTKSGKQVTADDIIQIVQEDTKDRYSLKENDSMIRANQGHSISTIDLELKPLSLKEIPNWLYHGTDSRFVEPIEKEGLKPMGRQYVHLSDNPETANNVGARRKKKDTETHIFKISTVEAVNAGVVFYKSENGVYLTKSVPAWLLR